MAESKPVLTLLMLEAIGIGALALWWATLPAAERWQRLSTIVREEGALPLLVDGAWAQAQWLLTHRLAGLQGMVGVVVIAIVMGIGEGLAHRQQDVLGGFRLTAWTLGVVSLPLALGGAGAYLIVPWPLSAWWVAVGLMGLMGLMGYLLIVGRPYVP